MPTPPDDVLLNKAAIIERCIRRIREEAAAAPGLDHPTHVDALTLNVERACQAAIDMAMHVVAERRLGIPQSNAHAFQLLERDGVIGHDLAKALGGMVGFQNVVAQSRGAAKVAATRVGSLPAGRPLEPLPHARDEPGRVAVVDRA